MFSTESVMFFLIDVVAWVRNHEYVDGSDNTCTSEDGYLSLTIRPGGISARAVLPVFSDNGRCEMAFGADRDAFTPGAIKEAVQDVATQHGIMSWLVSCLRSYGWHVSNIDDGGKSLTADRTDTYGVRGLSIRVYSDIVDRSIRIEGNGQSLVSMHLNHAGFLKTSDNVPECRDRFQIADWLLNQYDF